MIKNGATLLTATDKRAYKSVRNRDKQRCIICGHHITEVHHVIYRSHGGITDKRNMVLLCRKHHEEAHQNEREWRERLLDYLMGYYGMLDKKMLTKQNKWVRAFEGRTNAR